MFSKTINSGIIQTDICSSPKLSLSTLILVKFTNIASVVAFLAASTQAASFNPSTNTAVTPESCTANNNVPSSNPSNVPTQVNKTNTGSNAQTSNTQSETKTEAPSVPGPGPVNVVATEPAVTFDSPIEAKIKKLMSMGTKFGDFNDVMVKGFLKPEEWGRIDYYNNDAVLSEDLLRKVMTEPSPFIGLTPEEKAERIMALVPTPQKMGDLNEGLVKGILTAEEWGKVDLRDNNEPITAELLVQILKS